MVCITAAAYRVFKKLPKDVREHLVNEATKLKIDPLIGEQLHGKYRMLRSVSYRGVAYRIIYQVFTDKNQAGF
jgi:mRNA-degrading endonuclease RelE of RelBE toxin-antitoxin system